MTSVAMEKQNQVQLKIVEVFGCARQEGNRKKTKIEKKSIETTFWKLEENYEINGGKHFVQNYKT